jgi:hypothetical protein
MTLLSFVIFTIFLVLQCTTMETDIDTKTIQHGGKHAYSKVSIKRPVLLNVLD